MTQQSTEQAIQPDLPFTPAAPITPAAPATAATAEAADADRRLSQLVPVNESIRYRRRAQQAEQRATQLQQELDQQQRTRTQLEAQLAAATRRGELMQQLTDRGVIDLEAALLLAEQRLNAAGSSSGPGCPEDGPAHSPTVTPEDVIEQLLKDKPYLVRPKSGHGESAGGAGSSGSTGSLGGPMQGRRPGSRTSALELLRSAAQRATGTGRGSELENYLRLRRRMK